MTTINVIIRWIHVKASDSILSSKPNIGNVED